MNYLEDFNRMVGVGPSILEATAADPTLAVLAKAFSVKVMKPADVKFLRYRKVGSGVELEDAASKFGGILTSVESGDADPKALLAFLKKHGAKPAPKVEAVEPLDEALAGVEKQIVQILLMGKQVVGKADWYTVAQIVPNIPRVKEATIRKKLKDLESKKIIELSGDRFRLIAKTQQKAPKARGRKPYKFMGSKNPFHEASEGLEESTVRWTKQRPTEDYEEIWMAKTGMVDLIVKKVTPFDPDVERPYWVWIVTPAGAGEDDRRALKNVHDIHNKAEAIRQAEREIPSLTRHMSMTGKWQRESVEMTEKTKRDWYEDGRGMWRKEGTRFAAYVRDHGRYVEWNVSTVKGTQYSASGQAANVKAGMKAAEQGARKLAQEIKDERAHTKRMKAQPRSARPMKGAAWESIADLMDMP